MTDVGERSERATPKRLKEARDKGRIATSKDFTAWASVGVSVATLPLVIGSMSQVARAAVLGVGDVIRDPEPARALGALGGAALGAAGAVAPLLIAAFAAAIAASAAQGGIHLKRLVPDAEHLNPLNGLKRIFGVAGLWEGGKALLKSAVVAVVLIITVRGLLPVLMSAGALPVDNLIGVAAQAVSGLVVAAVAVGIGLSLLDLFVVQRRNRKHTRMTKREVKDESKNSEGDPLVRSQRRSRQLTMSRGRMVAAVQGADVVLLNPTHVAVALKYEPGRSAPRVVAKGADEIAARIREQATEHRVPMVRDIPLARALHASCEVGQEIPVELYSAVARVLAFVLALKRRGAARGVHEVRPVPTPRSTPSITTSIPRQPNIPRKEETR